MKFALSLLAHCPPQAAMQTQTISSILSGDFTTKINDASVHNSQFFDSIVQSIPDCVIVCNSNLKITNVNKATERIYGEIGNDAFEFFTKNQSIKGDTNGLFEKDESSLKIEFK